MYQNVKKLTHDERNFGRFQYMRKAADVLIRFYEMGFRTFGSVNSVLNSHGYSGYSDYELRMFWHFKLKDEVLLDQLEICIEKLKAE